MYCNTIGWAGNCIATEKAGWREKIVSQYKNCIVTAKAVGCWTVSQHRAMTRPAGPRHGAGRAASARARPGRERGAQAAGAWGAQAAGAAGARQERGTGARGALAKQQAHWRAGQQAHRRAAQALGEQPGRAGWLRLCTRCTQLVFGPG